MALVLRYADVAPGRPYHAALVAVRSGFRDRQQPHSHRDFHELLFVTAGRGVQRLGGKEIALHAGDVLLVRPHDRHEFAGRGPAGLQFINVAFPSERWRAFTDLAAVATARWDHGREQPTAHVGVDSALGAAFRRTLAAYATAPKTLDVVRLWTTVVPELKPDHDGMDTRPPWLVAADVAMRAEDNVREGLPRLLALAGVSHGHLARSMRAHHGCTPVAFVTERRLAHAALLLGTTTEGIEQIAARCGFSSLSYFGRRFRERYGVSPRGYRERAWRAVLP